MEDPTRHPAYAVVAGLQADLDSAGPMSLVGLGADEAGRLAVALARVEARLAELKHRVLAHAASVGVEDASGATSTAAWWSIAARVSRAEAHRQIRLADALDRRSLLREFLAAGLVGMEQAAVIARALDDLPEDLDDGLQRTAEAHLVDLAARHDARELKVLGRHLPEVVAPEVGQAHAARLLEAEERAAAESARLTLTPDGHGQVHGRFTLPTLHAAMLRKALLALSAPPAPVRPVRQGGEARSETGAPVPPRPTPGRWGQAFCELLERLDPSSLPSAGGTSATIVVTMTLDGLLGGLAEASIDTGEAISAATARRLACQAGLVPTVLGGAGIDLDQGRQRRFFSRTARLALATRDLHCTVTGCDIPPALCHAHHDLPWSRGGPTTMANGRLLCPRHHRMVHDPLWTTRPGPDRTITLVRRT